MPFVNSEFEEILKNCEMNFVGWITVYHVGAFRRSPELGVNCRVLQGRESRGSVSALPLTFLIYKIPHPSRSTFFMERKYSKNQSRERKPDFLSLNKPSLSIRCAFCDRCKIPPFKLSHAYYDLRRELYMICSAYCFCSYVICEF